MSVSLALIPLALTLRLVMSKRNFNNWVDSMQEKVATTFTNELELVRTVRRAGYDAEKWGGHIKTHIEGENLFFFWELIDGKWTAIFGKSDSKQKIERFMVTINEAAGRNIFEQYTMSDQAPGLLRTTTSTETAPAFPTNFRDGELLFSTLKEFGINPIRQGSSIKCMVDNSTLTFRQSGDSPFHVEIQNAPDLRKIFEYLSDIDDDYKQCLQAIVYEKLKTRVAEKNMDIESEVVLEDNSIVLTINIRS